MKQFFFLLLLALTLLLGCDKSYEKFDPNMPANTDSVWANSMANVLPVNDLKENLALSPLIDSVSAQNGGNIYFPNNIIVSIPANAFLLYNIPITDGKVTVKLQLITKKGDMIRMVIPTQSNGYLLESGGEINLDISRNNKPLTLATGKQIIMKYKSIDQPNTLIKGFTGTMPGTVTGPYSCFNWNSDDTNVKVSVITNGYQIITSSLQWIGCDYFNDSASAKTTVAVSMPLGFSNANTYVFVVFKNSNAVMQFDADAVNKIWLKNKMTINKQVEYISISKRDDDYYLGIYDTNTSVNQYVVLKPTKQKIQDIINYLETL